MCVSSLKIAPPGKIFHTYYNASPKNVNGLSASSAFRLCTVRKFFFLGLKKNR